MAAQPTRALAERLRGRPSLRVPAKPVLSHIEREHAARIIALLAQYREIVEAAIYPQLEYVGVPQPPRFDDAMDILERTFSGLRIRIERIFSDGAMSKIATMIAQGIDTSNRDLFRRQVKTVLGVDPLLSEPWLLDEIARFVRENASLIKSIPAENLSDIEQMVYRETKRNLSPTEMRGRIAEQFDVSENRAKLIARDQVSKFNGSLTELRQRDLGVTRYIWHTAHDERVRPDHRRLDGTTQRWDKPPITVTNGKRSGERNHPGSDIACRCYAEPIMDDIFK
jgi:SPP1 gp7 family putative phage head morphogenesis protein